MLTYPVPASFIEGRTICCDCKAPFLEGQSFAERRLTEFRGFPPVVEVICLRCASGQRQRSFPGRLPGYLPEATQGSRVQLGE